VHLFDREPTHNLKRYTQIYRGPSQVMPYLGRYTHRIAISDHWLLAFDGESVTFRWKDYAHGGKQKTMTWLATEFLRRLFLHVLPKGCSYPSFRVGLVSVPLPSVTDCLSCDVSGGNSGVCRWSSGAMGAITISGASRYEYATAENSVSQADLHATFLHQLGLDHERLTYDYEGRAERSTTS
jgi:hypothetical protein